MLASHRLKLFFVLGSTLSPPSARVPTYSSFFRKPSKINRTRAGVRSVPLVNSSDFFSSSTKGTPVATLSQFRELSSFQRSQIPTMSNEEVNVVHEPEQNRFILKYVDVDEPAFLSYVLSEEGTVYNMNHTYTPPSLRGKGIAGKLVRHAIAYARENEYKIIPTCWYVALYMERHPEERDVLKVD